jgi:hypothetical protein
MSHSQSYGESFFVPLAKKAIDQKVHFQVSAVCTEGNQQ